MSNPAPSYATLDEWVAQTAIPFALESPAALNAAIDQLVAALDRSVELLGFGEALHGSATLLELRNRLFQRLVEAHGFSAIAIESSFPRGWLVNDYVAGHGPTTSAAVMEAGFSHGFGRVEANRELVEWLRHSNADPARRIKLRFYGFDSPTEMTHTDSPRQLLQFALDYLTSIDPVSGETYRQRIDPLLGQDADWANPAAMMDPAQSIGLSPAATALRLETEELITELHVRRPELVAQRDISHHRAAWRAATLARRLLTYHAGLARPSSDRVARLLGLRDAMMADNLTYIAAQERGRGRTLVFAHNSHLKRSQMQWRLGPHDLTWWPAGAQLEVLFGARYAVIGSAVGSSTADGIALPEAGSLEAKLTAAPGPARFLPTSRGQGLPAAEIAALPTRSGSSNNSTYFPLTGQSLADFDWLVAL